MEVSFERHIVEKAILGERLATPQTIRLPETVSGRRLVRRSLRDEADAACARRRRHRADHLI